MKKIALFTVMLFICIVTFAKDQSFLFNRIENLDTEEIAKKSAIITLTDERTIVFSLANWEPMTFRIIEEEHTKSKHVGQIINVTKYYCAGGIIIHFFAGEKLMVSLQDKDLALFFWYEKEIR